MAGLKIHFNWGVSLLLTFLLVTAFAYAEADPDFDPSCSAFLKRLSDLAPHLNSSPEAKALFAEIQSAAEHHDEVLQAVDR